jgi:type VI secretion system secreted protein VgrG
MPSYQQAGRLMKFSSVLGEDVLLIEGLQGSEAISRLFDFRVGLLAVAGTEVDPKEIIGTKATVEIALLEVQGSRYINGLVASFEQMSGDSQEFDIYRLQMVPSLWQLKLSSNCRVFQSMTVMDIVKKVISPYGLSMEDQTEGTLQPLDYCTQYSESDFDFISRITEQHGIFYWFQHTEDDNKVIFGNSRTPYTDCPLVYKAKYFPVTSEKEEAYVSVVHEISATASMIAGQYTTWDYDFRTYQSHQIDPKASASAYGQNAFELYNWPAGEEGYVKDATKQLTTPDHGTGFIAAVAGASDASAEVYRGQSSARSFCPGYTFEMTDNPRDAWNRSYLLTEVAHIADQVPTYRSRGAGTETGYKNSFTAIPSDVLFRPPFTTRRPRIYGPQTALVVAPAGDEIYLDKYGRVCVQFFWDRDRKPNTPDNTWLRVAQPWASNGWGAYFWPRVNDEVIVQFINGDPDDPIVIGSVYNGTNMPPYALPANGTRSGILTRSSKDGSASTFNELRFEDKKGSEQVYLHAEMDMDQSIEHDLRVSIGNNDSLTVGVNQAEKIGGNANRTVAGNLVESIGGNSDLSITGKQTEKVGGDLSIQVGGDHNHKVSGDYGVDSGGDVYIKGAMNVVIEAGMQLTLKSSGGFITIDPTGVSISGTMVLINSGGAAGSGSPVQASEPASPTTPDTAEGSGGSGVHSQTGNPSGPATPGTATGSGGGSGVHSQTGNPLGPATPGTSAGSGSGSGMHSQTGNPQGSQKPESG